MTYYDPALAFEDRLPQPYRMIDKILQRDILGPVYRYISPDQSASKIHKVRTKNTQLACVDVSENVEMETGVSAMSSTPDSKTLLLGTAEGSILRLTTASMSKDKIVSKTIIKSSPSTITSRVLHLSNIVDGTTNGIQFFAAAFSEDVEDAKDGNAKDVGDPSVVSEDDAVQTSKDESENSKGTRSDANAQCCIRVYRQNTSGDSFADVVALAGLLDDEKVVRLELSQPAPSGAFYLLVETDNASVLLFPVLESPASRSGVVPILDAAFVFRPPKDDSASSTSRPLFAFSQQLRQRNATHESVTLCVAWTGDVSIRKSSLPSPALAVRRVADERRKLESTNASEDSKGKGHRSSVASKSNDEGISENERRVLARQQSVGFLKDSVQTSTAIMLTAGVSAVSMRGRAIAVGCDDGSLSVWNGLSPVDLLIAERAHRAPVTSVDVYREDVLVSGATDGTVFFHRVDPCHVTSDDRDALICATDGDGVPIVAVRTLPDTALAIVTNAEGATFVYAIDTGRCVGTLGDRVRYSASGESNSLRALVVSLDDAVFVAKGRANESDALPGPLSMFCMSDILGHFFPAIGLSLSTDMSRRTGDGAVSLENRRSRTDRAKEYFSRARPQQRNDPTIRLCIEDNTTTPESDDGRLLVSNRGDLDDAPSLRVLTTKFDRRAVKTGTTQPNTLRAESPSMRTRSAKTQSRDTTRRSSPMRAKVMHASVDSDRGSVPAADATDRGGGEYVVLRSTSAIRRGHYLGSVRDPSRIASSFLQQRFASDSVREARHRHISQQRRRLVRMMSRRS